LVVISPTIVLEMTTPSPPAIFTIGHSTRAADEFVAILRGHGVELLVDIRTVPRSRHNPQFGREELAETLRAAGISYLHDAGLGGLRKPVKDSANGAWRNDSFRGYADYMQTEAFAEALDRVVALGREHRLALMCAEGSPFRCHRSLVADALLARGIASLEISSAKTAKPRRVTSFGVIKDGGVSYPPPAEAREEPGKDASERLTRDRRTERLDGQDRGSSG
jgi:uncharacterized protein (DUF488 family)